MAKGKPIREKITGLRQRQLADGSWRVWWEPPASQRALGRGPVTLDADRPAWTIREAKRLNSAGSKSAAPRQGGRTVDALIARYKADDEYKDKKPATRAGYDKNLAIISAKWGDERISDFTKPMIREWYLACRATRGAHMAQALVRQFSILFSFAELTGWREEDSNPCYRLKLKAPPRRRRIATWPEVDALLAVAADKGLPSVATAILMSLLQGQRQTDVLEARVGHVVQIDANTRKAPTATTQARVWAWDIKRSKRGTLGMIQLHPEVEAAVLPLLANKEPDDVILRDDRTGKDYLGYPHDLFRDRWEEVRSEAAKRCPSIASGDDRLQFRDLRRTFAVWSRGSGATGEDVADALGNNAAKNSLLADIYMPPSFETASRAVLAIARPNNQERKKA